MNKLDRWFEAFATRVDRFTSTSRAFAGACLIVAIWAASGPIFHFSDTWQLVINTGTTIVTFLMVFLLNNSSARSAQRDREAAERDAEINREAFSVLQVVREHVAESQKLHDRTLKLLVKLEGQETKELQVLTEVQLTEEDTSRKLADEINRSLRPDPTADS